MADDNRVALLFIDLKHQICNCLDLGKILLLQRPSHQGHNKLTDAGNPWKVTGENSVASFPGHSYRQYIFDRFQYEILAVAMGTAWERG